MPPCIIVPDRSVCRCLVHPNTYRRAGAGDRHLLVRLLVLGLQHNRPQHVLTDVRHCGQAPRPAPGTNVYSEHPWAEFIERDDGDVHVVCKYCTSSSQAGGRSKGPFTSADGAVLRDRAKAQLTRHSTRASHKQAAQEYAARQAAQGDAAEDGERSPDVHAHTNRQCSRRACVCRSAGKTFVPCNLLCARNDTP